QAMQRITAPSSASSRLSRRSAPLSLNQAAMRGPSGASAPCASAPMRASTSRLAAALAPASRRPASNQSSGSASSSSSAAGAGIIFGLRAVELGRGAQRVEQRAVDLFAAEHQPCGAFADVERDAALDRLHELEIGQERPVLAEQRLLHTLR